LKNRIDFRFYDFCQFFKKESTTLIQNEPIFSVIIPAYNAEHFVCEALDSVASQTISDYEIIVVDDGSTDGTSRKISSWAKEHPLVKLRLVQQANKGMGGARNAGIQEACGIYVAFLDSDDVWLEKKLEFVADHIKKVPGVDVVCHDEWLQVDKAGKKRLVCGPHATYRDLLFKGNCFFLSATVARRKKVLEIGGFSEDIRRIHGVEDYDLWLRLAKADCSIEYLHEVLGVYRVYGQGITANIPQHCRHTLNVLDAHFQKWQPKTLYYRYLIRQCRATILRGSGHAFMKRSNHRDAQKYLCMALKQDPFNWETWVLALLNIARISK